MKCSKLLNSFTTTIDYPAVFTGISSTGYQQVARSAKCSVTHDCQVKYDSETKGFVNSFDEQTAAMAENTFIIANNGKFGVDTANGVLTNVAYSEGDIMMLDVSIKAVDDGTDDLLIIDMSVQFMQKCNSFMGSFLGILVGFILGAGWYTIIKSSGYDSLLYYNDYIVNNTICKRPKK